MEQLLSYNLHCIQGHQEPGVTEPWTGQPLITKDTGRFGLVTVSPATVPSFALRGFVRWMEFEWGSVCFGGKGLTHHSAEILLRECEEG